MDIQKLRKISRQLSLKNEIYCSDYLNKIISDMLLTKFSADERKNIAKSDIKHAEDTFKKLMSFDSDLSGPEYNYWLFMDEVVREFKAAIREVDLHSVIPNDLFSEEVSISAREYKIIMI